MEAKKGKRLIASVIGSGIALAQPALAHCPLCTVGAAAAAAGAAYFGVSDGAIGVFIGAFGASMGYWISRVVKRKYNRSFFPLQTPAFILGSFLLTVIPILPIFKGFVPLPLLLFGEYGSFFNRTYLLNTFFIGSVIGAVITSLTPWLSSKITLLRKGKFVPFQGIILTFVLLLAAGVLFEVLL